MQYTSALLFLAFLSFASQGYSQNVGIGTDNPDQSASLEIVSDSSGLLMPRMTSMQRDAIDNPATGLMVFVISDSTFYCFDGDDWVTLNSKTRLLEDGDRDTRVHVEKTTDEDLIRFEVQGTDYFLMNDGHLEVVNTGGSVFVGTAAGLNDDKSNNQNTGVGDSTLASTVNGAFNTAVGHSALMNNTGQYNTAMGNRALMSNSSGQFNTAAGFESLKANSFGSANTAVGYQAMADNTFGSLNVALGHLSLHKNTSGNTNTAYGYQAMYSNTTGGDNTGSGANALVQNTTGHHNTGMGSAAVNFTTTGSWNTGVGASALLTNQSGERNTALGFGADVSVNDLVNATAVGANAIVSQDSSLVLGDAAFVGIGTSAPAHPLHMGSGAHVTTAGVWTNASDLARKKEIDAMPYGLNEVLRMTPCSYTYIIDSSPSLGFIAQEMEHIIPEVVSGEDGNKGIAYGLLAPVIVQAMQEQQALLENQGREIDALKRDNARLSKMLETIMASLDLDD